METRRIVRTGERAAMPRSDSPKLVGLVGGGTDCERREAPNRRPLAGSRNDRVVRHPHVIVTRSAAGVRRRCVTRGCRATAGEREICRPRADADSRCEDEGKRESREYQKGASHRLILRLALSRVNPRHAFGTSRQLRPRRPRQKAAEGDAATATPHTWRRNYC